MTDQLSKTTSLADFQPIEKIGQGSFSSVYKVKRYTDDRIYALKKVRLQKLSQKQINNSLNQVRILASIQSPFIVQYKQAFFDEKANSLCVVMEYANEGDLQKIIETRSNQIAHNLLDQVQIWKAAINILSGLQLLHSKGILHRDLKTANIFISEGIYKIGDMNVSKVQSQQQQMAYTQTGTPYYASPEIWRDQPYDAKSDIWSFGCILYEMCTFHPPFEGKDIQSLYKCIKKGKYQAIPDSYSKELSDFISQCLNRVAKQRPTADDLIKNKNSVVNKKCKEYNIAIKRDSSFNLLKTIHYKGSQNKFSQKLPIARYQLSVPLKNTSQETLEKSPDDKLSHQAILSEPKTETAQKKLCKLQKIKRLQEKLTSKLKRMMKYSDDKNISETDRKSSSKIRSMKNIIDLQEIKRSPRHNRSQKNVASIVDVTHLYPKIVRNRNLTTQRRQMTEIEEDPKELDVIKQIRKKHEQKNKQKKFYPTTSQTHKVQQITKKKSAVNVKKDEEHKFYEFNKNKQRSSFPHKERYEQAFANHLRKISKKDSVKNYNSIPSLSKPTNVMRIETDFNRVQPIIQEENTSKRVYFLKKKSKNYPRVQ